MKTRSATHWMSLCVFVFAMCAQVCGQDSDHLAPAPHTTATGRVWALLAPQENTRRLPKNDPAQSSSRPLRQAAYSPATPTRLQIRFSDRELVDASENQSSDRANSSTQQGSSKLSTAAMLAPLNDATQLLNRLSTIPEPDEPRLDNTLPRQTQEGFGWNPSSLTWTTPSFAHRPLYFEQPNLERFGTGCVPIIQPVASAAHFFGNIPLLPYKALKQHPLEKVYTLGHGRPGNCVPWMRSTLLGPSSLGESLLYYHPGSGYR